MSQRACILSVAGPDLLPAERVLLSRINPWGVILMGRSCVSRAQIRRLIYDIWDATGRRSLIFIDQEGGRVARLRAPEWPLFPSGADYGRLYGEDPERGCEAACLGHRLIAHELAGMGIHADCAPVLDLPVAGAHDVIGDRAFGRDPAQVSALGRAAIEGLAAGGVASVIKHIPGHGRSQADSHLELPRVHAGDNDLAKDFAPFVALNDAPMAMTAHIAYDAIDPGVPATLSPRLIGEVIRTRIGFNGLLMSDDLGMKALGGTLGERTQRALTAGCDVVLHCSGFLRAPGDILSEMQEVGEAATALAGKALARAQAADAVSRAGERFDPVAGWARLRQLLPAARAQA